MFIIYSLILFGANADTYMHIIICFNYNKGNSCFPMHNIDTLIFNKIVYYTLNMHLTISQIIIYVYNTKISY